MAHRPRGWSQNSEYEAEDKVYKRKYDIKRIVYILLNILPINFIIASLISIINFDIGILFFLIAIVSIALSEIIIRL